MKNLIEYISEGVFDKNIGKATDKKIITDWVNTFVKDSFNSKPGKNIKIDFVKKQIIFEKVSGVNSVYIDATSQDFGGFIGFTFVGNDGKEFKRLRMQGEILSTDEISSQFETIEIPANKQGKLYHDVCDGLNQLKSIKDLCFFGSWGELDLRKLTVNCKNIYVGDEHADNRLTKTGKLNIYFNTTQKVDAICFGYQSITSDTDVKLITLPNLKTISFKDTTYDNAKRLLDNIQDTGNVKSLKINARNLNNEEKDSLISLVNSNKTTSFGGYDDIIKKCESVNSNMNNNDSSKDAFNNPLSPGDFVIVWDSGSLKVDICKGVMGKYIKLGIANNAVPKNVALINNPILNKLK